VPAHVGALVTPCRRHLRLLVRRGRHVASTWCARGQHARGLGPPCARPFEPPTGGACLSAPPIPLSDVINGYNCAINSDLIIEIPLNGSKILGRSGGRHPGRVGEDLERRSDVRPTARGGVDVDHRDHPPARARRAPPRARPRCGQAGHRPTGRRRCARDQRARRRGARGRGRRTRRRGARRVRRVVASRERGRTQRAALHVAASRAASTPRPLGVGHPPDEPPLASSSCHPSFRQSPKDSVARWP